MRSAGSDLDAVCARFVAWRARRRRPRVLPEELMRAAVRLLDRHSGSVVCRRLRLNSSRLKRAREAFGRAGAGTRGVARLARIGRPGIREAQRAFVELPSLALMPSGRPVGVSGTPCECRVVLEGVAGTRLSVEFARIDAAWLGAVCRLLLDSAPAPRRRPDEAASAALA